MRAVFKKKQIKCAFQEWAEKQGIGEVEAAWRQFVDILMMIAEED